MDFATIIWYLLRTRNTEGDKEAIVAHFYVIVLLFQSL